VETKKKEQAEAAFKSTVVKEKKEPKTLEQVQAEIARE
jgi:hypothetical protein